jgi:hypothetical protein
LRTRIGSRVGGKTAECIDSQESTHHRESDAEFLCLDDAMDSSMGLFAFLLNICITVNQILLLRAPQVPHGANTFYSLGVERFPPSRHSEMEMRRRLDKIDIRKSKMSISFHSFGDEIKINNSFYASLEGISFSDAQGETRYIEM